MKKCIGNKMNDLNLIKDAFEESLFAEWLTFKNEDFIKSADLLNRSTKNIYNSEGINWFIPSFDHPFGGIYTILRTANYLENKSFNNKFIIYDNPKFSLDSKIQIIQKHFPEIGKNEKFYILKNGLEDVPDSNVSISTLWTSCYYLIRLENCNHKVYFIQDFEPGFYNAGSLYGLAELTYFMPFHRIINTQGLFEYINHNYPINNNQKSIFFNPGVDKKYTPKIKKISEELPIKILFYARPSTGRNAFALGIKFLEKLNSIYGARIEIHLAGENINKNLGVPKYMIQDGIVPYQNLPAYYSQFSFGLCFMFSKHTSYLPLELMAAGAIVITNYNQSKCWLLKDGYNSIHELPDPNILLKRFETICNSDDEYTTMVTNAYKTVLKLNWDDNLHNIYKFVTTELI